MEIKKWKRNNDILENNFIEKDPEKSKKASCTCATF